MKAEKSLGIQILNGEKVANGNGGQGGARVHGSKGAGIVNDNLGVGHRKDFSYSGKHVAKK